MKHGLEILAHTREPSEMLEIAVSQNVMERARARCDHLKLKADRVGLGEQTTLLFSSTLATVCLPTTATGLLSFCQLDITENHQGRQDLRGGIASIRVND